MCIIINRGGAVSQRHRRTHNGFTLPEVLVSLIICMLLMQSVSQWGVLTARNSERIMENQEAVLIAQTILAGGEPDIPDGWEVQMEKKQLDEALQEWEITVKHEKQQWQFYYAGE